MHRRDFLKTGIQATAITAVASLPASAAPATLGSSRPVPSPSLMAIFTEDDHRRRLQNIALGMKGIRTCMRKQLITNYLSGHCCYNLGEYPSRTTLEPR